MRRVQHNSGFTVVHASLCCCACLAMPAMAGAADTAPFPRGPGLYLNPSAVILTLLAYFGWVRACWWVDRDARRLGIEAWPWNALVFAGGIAGLLLLWLVPIFLLAYPLLLLCYLGPVGFYVQQRNPHAPPDRQVWTAWHFKKLFRRHLRVELPIKDEPPTASRVRLKLRTRDPGEEKRLRRLKDSPGYSRLMDLLADAVRQRATDVKLIPARRGVAVEFRIDGVGHPEDSLPKTGGESALQTAKALAGLDLSDPHRPQEGGFSTEAERRRIDFRLHAPGAGQGLQLRVLDRSRQLLDLSFLGMSESLANTLDHALGQTRGLLVICGPPDSGKTTAAYACLNEIDRRERSVLVLDERQEIRLPKVSFRKRGDNLADEVTKALEEKPRVMLVGDVPDQETAERIVSAAKKKCLVLAVLQANDAIDGLFQLLKLGVRGPDLAEVLHGVLCVRLLRALCPFCRIRYLPTAESARKMSLPEHGKHLFRAARPHERRGTTPGRGPACPHCGDIGYHGRTAVFEYLLVTERIRGLLRDNPLAGPIRQEAVRAGLRFLVDEAMRLVAEGTTSVDEVLRVMR